MKIYVENDDGTMYKAIQTDKNTYTLMTDEKTYKLSLTESKGNVNLSTFSEEQRKNVTKAIFSNESIIEQLRDARTNRDNDFLYYSRDENEFDKLVDGLKNDR